MCQGKPVDLSCRRTLDYNWEIGKKFAPPEWRFNHYDQQICWWGYLLSLLGIDLCIGGCKASNQWKLVCKLGDTLCIVHPCKWFSPDKQFHYLGEQIYSNLLCLLRGAFVPQIRSFLNIVQKGGGAVWGQTHVQKFWRKFCTILNAFWQHKIDIKRLFKGRNVSNWV